MDFTILKMMLKQSFVQRYRKLTFAHVQKHFQDTLKREGNPSTIMRFNQFNIRQWYAMERHWVNELSYQIRKDHISQLVKSMGFSGTVEFLYLTPPLRNLSHDHIQVELNPFPYHWDGMHLLVWFKPDPSCNNSLRHIDLQNALCQFFLCNTDDLQLGRDFIYFENPIHMQSLPGSHHIHVFMSHSFSSSSFSV